MIYHGVAGQILANVDHQPHVRYSASAMLLGIDDPRTVIYRSPTPVLAPETADERAGIVPNVVFPTGIDLRENGRVDIYYGMADAAIGVARLDLPRSLVLSGAFDKFVDHVILSGGRSRSEGSLILNAKEMFRCGST